MTRSLAAQRTIAALALATAACATDTIAPDATKTATEFPIAPYEIHEECAQLVPGDRLDYRFEAKAPVAFQIYYKDGIMFVAPISRDDVKESAGIFRAPVARRYCLQWEAGQQGAVLDYRIRFLPAAAAP